MNRSAIVLTVASIATMAAFAAVTLGLSRVQAIRETASFSGMANHHMSYSNSTLCDDNVSSYMEATQLMGGSTYSGHEAMHNQLNMTEHMQDMHKVNITAPYMESNHGGCHD